MVTKGYTNKIELNVPPPPGHLQPKHIVKSLVPSWNTLVLFEVSPVSFHQVSPSSLPGGGEAGQTSGEGVPHPSGSGPQRLPPVVLKDVYFNNSSL